MENLFETLVEKLRKGIWKSHTNLTHPVKVF